ncbi:hypothetical protein [Desulfurivibrio sp. C05AmB]|jgi:hypothetical protein|uniref:hypothetical protein n=1 Tax=Desulfurivibrio sp. C05AmB TaxID=3374371 RepID=UPI00376F09CB
MDCKKPTLTLSLFLLFTLVGLTPANLAAGQFPLSFSTADDRAASAYHIAMPPALAYMIYDDEEHARDKLAGLTVNLCLGAFTLNPENIEISTQKPGFAKRGGFFALVAEW